MQNLKLTTDNLQFGNCLAVWREMGMSAFATPTRPAMICETTASGTIIAFQRKIELKFSPEGEGFNPIV